MKCNNINQWLHHYTCSGFCKTSYHLLISPSPTNLSNSSPTPYHSLISPPTTNLANTLKIHTGENKIDRQSQMWRQYTYYFPANGSTNPDFFSLKHSASQGESSLKISARWDSPLRRSQGTNKQTNKHTNSLTDRLALLQRDWIDHSE